VDEAVSALGLARSLSRRERIREILFHIQQELFIIGAELATPAEHRSQFAQKHRRVTPEMVQRLEDFIDELEGKMEMPHTFIIPGESAAAAALDLARAIVRRTERRVVSLQQEGLLDNEEVLKYLNRLADLVFTLARYESKEDTA
jgi:cob(I)alamin adenosyltransferase